MEIHSSEKKVSLSVGEFAEFNTVARGSRLPGAGIWRATLGITWHRELEKESAVENPNLRFEVPLEVTRIHQDWTLRFQGRIDQIEIGPDQVEIIEVKSVTRPLPIPDSEVREEYPSYLTQLATYCVLITSLQGLEEKTVSGTLLLVDINSGVQQRVALAREAQTLFMKQMEELYPFLQSRWTGHQRRTHLQLGPAFPHYREGQKETLQAVDQGLNRGPILFLEAPTGFGKTGIVLEQCLRRLQAGTHDRILYLTSKSTGQIQAIRQLERVIPWESNPPRYFQIRNRMEHEPALLELPAERLSPEDLQERWNQSGISPYSLLEEQPLPLDRILELARHSGLPAYEITRAALPFADIWVADFNYIFSPSTRGLLDNVPGFKPEATLLIVDEAHNLPSRTAAALSAEERADDWETLWQELRLRAASGKILNALRDWYSLLDGLKPTDLHATTLEYELKDILERLCQTLATIPLDWRDLTPETRDRLYGLYGLRTLLNREDLELLQWSPSPGVLRLTCLDAGPEIESQLSRFSHSILMSATLHPFEPFAVSCGLSAEQAQVIQAPAPWRDQAYQVAVDTRVDTRFKERERYYSHTAETIRLMQGASVAPMVAFFPSYRYAETIREYLNASDPLLRIAIQPRGVTLREQEAFIEESLTFQDILFLILGTGFSEGIDALGGQVDHALVVGPALPEVNAVQHAKMRQWASDRRQAFQRVYQIPAMQKINQALGRLVRAPGQRAKVLLHCRRFAEPDFQALLAEEYRQDTWIRDEDSLLLWLNR